jgi:NADH:ubiquinone reductase (H+-translocating)
MKPPSSHPTRSARVVVIGAGFAGLNFCRRIDTRYAHVTLIDRQNHHLFQPLLYQVATAGLSAPDIAQPIRMLLRDRPNLTVLMAEVQTIDVAARCVVHDRGEVAYDYLIVAAGGRTSYFGRDEWAQYAPGLKSLDDAIEIRRRLLLAFECAETEEDPQRREELMTIVVVGAGPTGVELAGAFSELARDVLAQDFVRINPRRARVVLVDAAPRVLPPFPEECSRDALRQLQQLGVEVRTGLKVQDLKDGEIDLGEERIRAANIFWAAGVGGSPLGAQLGAEVDRGGRVAVLPDLTIPGHPEVFVLGDLVKLVDPKGQLVPGVAPAAMQMGRYAAQTVNQELAARDAGRSPPDRPAYVYRDKGTMATIGRSAAVAAIGKIRLSGFLAWLAWLFVHLMFLVGLRNKISVASQWIYSYLTFKRAARVITGIGSPPAELNTGSSSPPPASSRT